MLQAFGSVGGIGFIIMSFVVATGIAASPTLLPRSGTTPGVYEARKSGGWAVLVVGLVLLTLPAVAVYLRSFVLEQVVNLPPDRLPVWFQLLQQAGIARIEARAPLVGLTNVGFERDAVLFALPIAAGLPQVIVYLSLAGALAAALAALAASMVAAAAILSEDVVHGLPNETVPDSARVGTARLALLGVAFVTVWLAIAAPADPLQLFLWALTFSASASFPVILLVHLVEAHQCLGGAGRHGDGLHGRHVHGAAERDRRHHAAERAGRCRRPAAGDRRHHCREPDDAGTGQARARHAARRARAGRGNALRPRDAVAAPEEPQPIVITCA